MCLKKSISPIVLAISLVILCSCSGDDTGIQRSSLVGYWEGIQISEVDFRGGIDTQQISYPNDSTITNYILPCDNDAGVETQVVVEYEPYFAMLDLELRDDDDSFELDYSWVRSEFLPQESNCVSLFFGGRGVGARISGFWTFDAVAQRLALSVQRSTTTPGIDYFDYASGSTILFHTQVSSSEDGINLQLEEQSAGSLVRILNFELKDQDVF